MGESSKTYDIPLRRADKSFTWYNGSAVSAVIAQVEFGIIMDCTGRSPAPPCYKILRYLLLSKLRTDGEVIEALIV